MQNVIIDMIADRKLSISFSDYIVHVIDKTTDTSYIEYHNEPKSGERKVKVHESRFDALSTALSNCLAGITSDDNIVMTLANKI